MKLLAPVYARIVAASALALAGTATQAQVLYANDFDAAAVVAAGVTATGLTNGSTGVATGSYAGSGGKSWSGNFFYNDSTGNPATASTLTLSNLGAHSSITIDLMLGFLNSWDSTDGSPAPDYLDVYIDGTLVKKLTTITAGGSVTEYGGGTLVCDNCQIDGNQFYSDDLVDMGTATFLTLAHTASTLTITFQASGAGWQGGGDEFWGLDALRVTAVPAVPEPAPATLMLVGAAAVAALRQWRRRRA